jgi:hypothetical protein
LCLRQCFAYFIIIFIIITICFPSITSIAFAIAIFNSGKLTASPVADLISGTN